MRMAVVCWEMVGQIGGIATRLNNIRLAAIRAGDQCDVLFSGPRPRSSPHRSNERRKVRGKDNWIYVDGDAPHHPSNVAQTLQFLQREYDAVCFGYICPTQTKKYPEPLFRRLYEVDLPKIAWLSDGYWQEYAHWAAEFCLPNLKRLLVPVETYAAALTDEQKQKTIVVPFPFSPRKEVRGVRSSTPLLVWPNQWKGVKGIVQFVQQLPNMPEDLAVEMYSCGVTYYQMRSEPYWKQCIGEDRFGGFNGDGRAVYHGNVEIAEAHSAMRRAWFTCNLQGMKSRKEAYRQGSYNNTEVEALYYGAMPILHSSALNTPLPKECYAVVDSADDLPALLRDLIDSGAPLKADRIAAARSYVEAEHSAAKVWETMKRTVCD